MGVLYICRECDKPKKGRVEGKPRNGKKLGKKLAECSDLPFDVRPCKCLGKCKKGPNGLLMPGKVRLHRLTVKFVRAFVRNKMRDSRR